MYASSSSRSTAGPSSKVVSALFSFLLLVSSVTAQRWKIGDFATLDHDVAGSLYAVSEHVLEVESFVYDGGGPASYFWVSSGATPSASGRILADASPSNGCGMIPDDGNKLPSADGTQTYRMEFPLGVGISDYLGGSISVWCTRFSANFGHVTIPADFLDTITLPDDVPRECFDIMEEFANSITTTPTGFNCEELNDQLQVRWQVDEPNNALNVQLIGQIPDNTYAGFGISGRDTETFMIGADAVVSYFDGDTPIIRDFYLDDRSRCSAGRGVCPDTATSGLTNDVSNVAGKKESGLSLFEYTRPLSRSNTQSVANNLPSDRSISTTPGDETFILWAMGPINEDGLPLIHTSFSGRGDASISLDFGRAVSNNCQPLLMSGQTLAPTASPPPPFIRPDVGDEELIITAHIGPSGGPRGYVAIAERPSWGIAWYMNGILVPRVILRRGKTYTFKVNGGDDPNTPASFHPFYITDNPRGGFKTLTPEERAKEKVFAGIDLSAWADTTNGIVDFTPTAVGPICRYKASGGTEAAELGSFESYIDTLDQSCAEDASIIDNAAILTFTPGADTPDKLYYQCVTHPDLGFEIFVLDVGEALPTDAPTQSPTTAAAPPGDFIEVPLVGQLEGGIMRYRVNLADERANGEDTLSVIVETPRQAWVGWAVSTTGNMVGSESVIGLPDTGEVFKYTMTSQSGAGVNPRDATQQTLIEASIVQGAASTTLSFTKIMVEAGEIAINPNVPNTFLTAFGSGNRLGVHAVRDSYSLSNLQGGSVRSIQTRKQDLWKAHGWFAGIAWTVLCPLAIGAGLLRRFIPGQGLWFQIHRGLNTLVIIFTIIAFSLAVAAINQETPDGGETNHFNSDPNPHRLVGLVIFIVSLVQALNGILRPHVPGPKTTDEEEQSSRPAELEEKSIVRKGWEVGHRFIGVACLAMSWYQINAGIDIYNKIFRPTEDNNLQSVFWGVALGLTGAIILGAVAAKFLPEEAVPMPIKEENNDKKSAESEEEDS